MRVIANGPFVPVFEHWDDPGDYPNAYGSRPMVATSAFVSIDGNLIIEFNSDRLAECAYQGDMQKLANKLAELPPEISHVGWSFDLCGNKIVGRIGSCRYTADEGDW